MPAQRTATSVILLALALAAGWVILSGRFEPFYLAIGVASAVVIALIARPPEDATPFRVLRLAAFLPWLAWQIVKSNLRVARLVLSREMPIRPTLLRRAPGVTGGRPLTLLGISTTLTPGTLTVDVDADEFVVHALDQASVDEVRQGTMARQVARVFGQEAP